MAGAEEAEEATADESAPAENGDAELAKKEARKLKKLERRAKSKSPRRRDTELGPGVRLKKGLTMGALSGSAPDVSSKEDDSPGPVRAKEGRRAVRSMLTPAEAEAESKGGIRLRTDMKRRSSRKNRLLAQKGATEPNLGSLELKIDMRKKLVEEIMSTEKTFISALEELTGGMLAKLMAISAEFGAAADLPEKELQLLYSAAGIILQYSKLLLEMLEPRVLSWSPTTCIGDIFLQLGDFMKIYTQYVKEYEPFVNKFQHARFKNKILREQLAELTQSGSTEFLSFESKLIVPVQRIPRYQLLLRDLFKHTPEEHPDRLQLEQALGKIEEIGAYVNERQRHYEGLNKVLQLQEMFGKQLTDNTGIQEFVRSHRRVMTAGMLKMVRSKDKSKASDVAVHLLNDIVLIGGPKSLSSGHGSGTVKLHFLGCLWEYLLTDIAPEPDEEDLFEFGLVRKGTEDPPLVLRAASQGQKREWVETFEETMENLSRAIVMGSEMERDRKISITHNSTKWNQGSIPPEIAQALAEEQALKRKASTLVTINASTGDSAAAASSGPASWSQGALPAGIAAALAEQSKSRHRGSTIGVGPAAAGGGVSGGDLPDSVAQLLAGQQQKPRKSPRASFRSALTSSDVSGSRTNAQKARSEPTGRRRRATTLNQTLKKVVKEPTTTAMDALLSPRGSRIGESKPERKPLGTMYARVLEVRKLKFKSSKETISGFVKFKLARSDHSTPVCPPAVHPVWKENNSFMAELFPNETGHVMEVELYNKLAVSEAFYGYININISTDKSNSRLVDKWFTLKRKNKVVGEIRLQLRYVAAEDYGTIKRETIQDVFDDSVEADLSLSEQRLVEYLADLGGNPFAGK